MRIQFMRVPGSTFVKFCQGKAARRCRPVAHVLPSDAKIVDTKADGNGNAILMVESESFEDLKEGDEIPFRPPTQFELIEYAAEIAANQQIGLSTVDALKGAVGDLFAFIEVVRASGDLSDDLPVRVAMSKTADELTDVVKRLSKAIDQGLH